MYAYIISKITIGGGDNQAGAKSNQPQDRAARGRLNHMGAYYGHSFIGSHRTEFSGGEKPSPDNHPYLAVVQHLWPGAKDNLALFVCEYDVATGVPPPQHHLFGLEAFERGISPKLDEPLPPRVAVKKKPKRVSCISMGGNDFNKK